MILITHLDHHISLRLDANRAWTLDEALEFASGIKGIKIEYCEESLKNPEQLDSFLEKSDLPIALDETLFNTENPELLPKIQYYRNNTETFEAGRLEKLSKVGGFCYQK